MWLPNPKFWKAGLVGMRVCVCGVWLVHAWHWRPLLVAFVLPR